MFGCRQCPVGQDRCPRCASALCGEHVPFAGDACAECELGYHEDKSTLHSGVWFALGAALPWLGYAAIYSSLPGWEARSGGARAITTGVPMLDVLIITAFCSVFVGKGVLGLRQWFHRRSFMKHELPGARVV